MQAFGLLSPEQQVSMREAFLRDGREANLQITGHLTEIQTAAASQMQATLNDIKTAVTAGAATQVQAANTQLEAANINASTNHNVIISVTDDRVDVDVTQNDGG